MTPAGSSLVTHPVAIFPGSPLLEIAGVVESSAVDGPGNRYVLFLQGCNFDCIACHNPTTIGRCDACGVCVDACPHGALDIGVGGGVVFDATRCDRCRACVAVCPIDADAAIRVVAAAGVVEELRRVVPFISGITVTGGEPTLQIDGLVALFSAIKADPELSRLTTYVDTNGTPTRRDWDRLLPVLDGAMVDLKAADRVLHERITGRGNDRVKDSIRYLHAKGKLAEVRLLVIEGITDTEAELVPWARFVRSVAPDVPVRLMGFRHTGTRPAAHGWPETSPDTMERVATRLTNLGLVSVFAG